MRQQTFNERLDLKNVQSVYCSFRRCHIGGVPLSSKSIHLRCQKRPPYMHLQLGKDLISTRNGDLARVALVLGVGDLAVVEDHGPATAADS